MIFKIRFGKWKLTLTLTPVVDVVGVNSKLPDGNHILMWDFDNVPLDKVEKALYVQQLLHNLPNIYILETTAGKNYVAYCFVRVPFMKAASIIADTMFVCLNYYKWGIFRRRFTLRITPKCGRTPRLVSTLKSDVLEEVEIAELSSFVQYETLPDHKRRLLIKLGERRHN